MGFLFHVRKVNATIRTALFNTIRETSVVDCTCTLCYDSACKLCQLSSLLLAGCVLKVSPLDGREILSFQLERSTTHVAAHHLGKDPSRIQVGLNLQDTVIWGQDGGGLLQGPHFLGSYHTLTGGTRPTPDVSHLRQSHSFVNSSLVGPPEETVCSCNQFIASKKTALKVCNINRKVFRIVLSCQKR